MKTTNYYNTFIEVAEDCPVDRAVEPPLRNRKSAVRIQYEMISEHPYTYTSDDVLFAIHAGKHEIPPEQQTAGREQFFSKGRACLRSSALGKRYGWGIHFDAEGKTAICAMDSEEYDKLRNDENLQHLKAMRSRRG